MYEKDISNVENQMISMYENIYPNLIISTAYKLVGYYGLGQILSTRDISNYIKDIYGFGISKTMVSKITNKIYNPQKNDRIDHQKKPTCGILRHYILLCKREQYCSEKTVYIALGYNLEDFKEILGMYQKDRLW